MALIQCPDCTKDISDSARACPQCGFARPSSAPQRVNLTDINISISDIAMLIVKCAFAAIPALLILLFFLALISGFFGAALLRN